MGINLKQFNRSKGIGLLELMLSLAIIAILLIMATRYYQSASDQNKRNQAVDMFSAVNGAVQAYKIDHAPDIDDANIFVLVEAGYLPPSFGSTTPGGLGKNPWGGDITLAIGSTGIFTVTMTKVPSVACTDSALRVNSTIAQTSTGSGAGSLSAGAICPPAGNVITAVYNL